MRFAGRGDGALGDTSNVGVGILLFLRSSRLADAAFPDAPPLAAAAADAPADAYALSVSALRESPRDENGTPASMDRSSDRVEPAEPGRLRDRRMGRSNGSDADSPALGDDAAANPPDASSTAGGRSRTSTAPPSESSSAGAGANSRRSTSTPGVLDGGLLVGGRFAASFSFMDVRRAASVGTSVSSSLTFVDASFAGDGVGRFPAGAFSSADVSDPDGEGDASAAAAAFSAAAFSAAAAAASMAIAAAMPAASAVATSPLPLPRDVVNKSSFRITSRANAAAVGAVVGRWNANASALASAFADAAVRGRSASLCSANHPSANDPSTLSSVSRGSHAARDFGRAGEPGARSPVASESSAAASSSERVVFPSSVSVSSARTTSPSTSTSSSASSADGGRTPHCSSSSSSGDFFFSGSAGATRNAAPGRHVAPVVVDDVSPRARAPTVRSSRGASSPKRPSSSSNPMPSSYLARSRAIASVSSGSSSESSERRPGSTSSSRASRG